MLTTFGVFKCQFKNVKNVFLKSEKMRNTYSRTLVDPFSPDNFNFLSTISYHSLARLRCDADNC